MTINIGKLKKFSKDELISVIVELDKSICEVKASLEVIKRMY